jgi:hypothetical protein
MEGSMRHLTVAALTLTVLATMFTATIKSGAVGTELARAEGYVQPDQRMPDTAVVQLGSTVPVR